jgi:hypothetical protein
VTCAHTNDLRHVRLDVFAGEYIAEYGWGAWKAVIGNISVQPGQILEFQCATYTPQDPFPFEQPARC